MGQEPHQEEGQCQRGQNRHQKKQGIAQQNAGPLSVNRGPNGAALLPQPARAIRSRDQQQHVQAVALPPRGAQGARPFLLVGDDRATCSAERRQDVCQEGQARRRRTHPERRGRYLNAQPRPRAKAQVTR